MNTYRKTLDTIIRAPIEEFAPLGNTVQTKHGPLTHIDNGGSILAVAHLDTVPVKSQAEWYGSIVMNCPELDDRLGVWAMLYLLPKLGYRNFDVLLTDSEEIGESTAQYVDELFAGKYNKYDKYNWMFQFDRAGDDVVMYDYEDSDCCNILEDSGFHVGSGAYSDICKLEHLGIKGFNFGIGYFDQHTKGCWADLADTIMQVRQFIDFAKEFDSVKLPHIADKWDDWDDWDDWAGESCDLCYEFVDSNWRYCAQCGNELCNGLSKIFT